MNQIEKLIPAHVWEQIAPRIYRQSIAANTEILREGQFVKLIPVVESGVIKVFRRYADKELLLYYIKPGETCIMSFSAALEEEPSKIFAVTEEDTDTFLFPADKIKAWIKEYPELNQLFLRQYNTRYTDLLETINHVLFEKMDTRILDYLKEKALLKNQQIIKISHREIASDLATAREVVSRMIKKLESEHKLIQHSKGIELL